MIYNKCLLNIEKKTKQNKKYCKILHLNINYYQENNLNLKQNTIKKNCDIKCLSTTLQHKYLCSLS